MNAPKAPLTPLSKAHDTPMMRQYMQAKAACPGALVMMRLGDFYEFFFEDAEIAAEILDLTLTARNKNDDDPIPMAGIPHHALDNYLPRLLTAGKKVAICEQVEDPKEAKGLVRREIVKIVSPGVILDEAALNHREPNWLATLLHDEESQQWATSWLDISTGEHVLMTTRRETEAFDCLARLEPKELLLASDRAPLPLVDTLRTLLPKLVISEAVPSPAPQLPFGDRAAAFVLQYAQSLSPGATLAIRPLLRLDAGASMTLPATTVRNLELFRAISDGDRHGTLFSVIDRTRTAMGSRLLRNWLLNPLMDPDAIAARQAIIEAFHANPIVHEQLRQHTRAVSDLERLITRIVARSASPRDMSALLLSLERIPPICADLRQADDPTLTAQADLDAVPEAIDAMRRTLVDAPPQNLKDGGVIRPGAHPELDELLAISSDGKGWLSDYELSLRQETGIASLKIKFNQVFGYFIEVTRANLDAVPDTWLRRQTLANSERYYTPELKEKEELVLHAEERRLALEERLFAELRDLVASFAPRIQTTAQRLAQLDALSGLAETASHYGWTRPTLVADPTALDIQDGRHPVVEAFLPTGHFIPNDLSFDSARRLAILTGPNMAGKSTVMRQVALIAILAQMGSYVPAQKATLGLVDQVFTRVGASDDLARGQSTFMVEMIESAEILNKATPQSLVILDEIGRGTSTWDGLSIAWAVAEFLVSEIGCRTLFATHYHELTQLSESHPRVFNLNIAVQEQDGEIVFLRRLLPGGANRSYGIQVARLADLPSSVLQRAQDILERLESRAEQTTASQNKGWQLSLFNPSPEPQPTAPIPSNVEDALRESDPDLLTPRQALDLIYKLKGMLP